MPRLSRVDRLPGKTDLNECTGIVRLDRLESTVRAIGRLLIPERAIDQGSQELTHALMVFLRQRDQGVEPAGGKKQMNLDDLRARCRARWSGRYA
jgi:hypothetical protein